MVAIDTETNAHYSGQGWECQTRREWDSWQRRLGGRKQFDGGNASGRDEYQLELNGEGVNRVF